MDKKMWAILLDCPEVYRSKKIYINLLVGDQKSIMYMLPYLVIDISLSSSDEMGFKNLEFMLAESKFV